MLQKIQQAPGRMAKFYTDVRNELRKVTWPSKNEVYGTTAVVLVSVFFFGIYLYLVDIVLNQAVTWITETFR
ncbi:MAG TPA: preprotein translocase subunit SecE [Acidobacteriota bacterium]|nr:preprotein translocase subunit SecE [Acidobacteriota bacterium]